MRSSRMLFTRSLPTVVICIFALILVACGGNAPANQPQSTGVQKASADKQIYVYPLGGVTDFATLDPALSTDLGSILGIDMMFTGLVQLDSKLQIIDQMAASHSVGADGLTWTFKLKPNLKFSDGNPITSQDVAYSIDRALKPSLKSVVAPVYLSLLKDSDKRNGGTLQTLIGDSIQTPDPQTVVLITTKKAAYFLDSLAYSCSYVVEKSLIDKYGDENFTQHLDEAGSTGPWKVLKYLRGQRIEFVPNPAYYGKIPQLKKLVIPFYKESDRTYTAYRAGQVSEAAVPGVDIAQAKTLPGGQFRLIPELWTTYYTMNYLVKPFDNIKIRQAFDLALDKSSIAHNIWKDTVIASNHIIPQGMPGYFPDLTRPGGFKDTNAHPNEAKTLFEQGLAEEGLTRSTLPKITITVSSGSSSDLRNEFAAVQQMWQNTLGITVNLDDIDFNKLLDVAPKATNNPNGLMAWNLGWIADYPDAQDWTTLLFGKGSNYNEWNYGQNHSADAAQQAATQDLMLQADVNPDPQARLQQYNQIEQQLVNDAAWTPVYQHGNPIVRMPCVVGIIDNPQLLFPPDMWGDVYISNNSTCANTTSYQ